MKRTNLFTSAVIIAALSLSAVGCGKQDVEPVMAAMAEETTPENESSAVTTEEETESIQESATEEETESIQESATDEETESATVPSYTVTELNKEMQATQNAMTYENPDGNTEVSGVKKDEVIAVIGKVDDTDWYQIDHEGFKSFIDGAFLKEIEQQPKQQPQQQQAQAPVPEQTQPPVQTPVPEQTPTPEQTQPPVQTPTPVPTPAPDVYVDPSSGYAEGYVDPSGKVLQKGGMVTDDGTVFNPGDEICPGLTFGGTESTESLIEWGLAHPD